MPSGEAARPIGIPAPGDGKRNLLGLVEKPRGVEMSGERFSCRGQGFPRTLLGKPFFSKVRIRHRERTPKQSIDVRGHFNRGRGGERAWQGKCVVDSSARAGLVAAEGRGGRGLYHPGSSDHRTR